jgi:hypothetical protein
VSALTIKGEEKMCENKNAKLKSAVEKQSKKYALERVRAKNLRR